MMKRTGFTFVELTLVMAIICILAVIAVPNFLEAQVRAAVSRSHADLATMKMALNSYRADYRALPPNAASGEPSSDPLAALTTPVVYMSSLPFDVFTLPEIRKRGHGDVVKEAKFFFYFNALEAAPETGLVQEEPRMLRQTNIPALLMGRGPGSLGSNKDFVAEISPGAKARLTPYDATNGTASLGDFYETLP